MSQKKNSNRLFCFSPAVMVGTFTVELFLAIYVTYRYGIKSLFNKLSVFLLFLLSVFQIAEFNICADEASAFWGRIGFVATALMPPIGLHLVSLVTKKRSHVPIAYILGLAFAGFFAFTSGSVNSAICGGNYVTFSTSHPLFHVAYGLYYTVFLLWGLTASFFSKDNLNKSEISVLRWIALGYTSFILPAALSYITFPYSHDSLASILCGFAILMALILAFAVVPKHSKLRALQDK